MDKSKSKSRLSVDGVVFSCAGGKGGTMFASDTDTGNNKVYIGGNGSAGQIVIYANRILINHNEDEDNKDDEQEQANKLKLFQRISNPKAILL
jgi:hypothetical protein